MPEITNLEPISTGDIIDRAVRLYRRNFIPLISVVAVPALIYYASAMMVSFGSAQALQNPQAGFNPAALFITLLGLVGYLVYAFAILSAIAGTCRAVGDHMMLGEPITFKGCWRFARRRLGDIVIMGLLLLPSLAFIAMVLGVVFLILFVGLTFVIGIGAATGMPPWIGGILTGLVTLAAVFWFVVVALVLVARLIFYPSVLMIEGRSAGAAFGRAVQLGGGRTWLRLGLIALFAYFVNFAVLTALVEPLMIVFWANGWSIADLFLHPGWNAVYAAVNQIATLLAWPLWITALTLLYFDTRVKKEGYDVELATAGLQVQPYAFAAPAPAFLSSAPQPAAPARRYMQTGPLGLGGYPVAVPAMPAPLPGHGLPPTGAGVAGPWEPPSVPEFSSSDPRPNIGRWSGPGAEPEIKAGTEIKAESTVETDVEAGMAFESPALETYPAGSRTTTAADAGAAHLVRCSVCGLTASPGAKYCIACGDLLQREETTDIADPR